MSSDAWDVNPEYRFVKACNAWRKQRFAPRMVNARDILVPDWDELAELLSPTPLPPPRPLPPPQPLSAWNPETLLRVEVGTVVKTGAPWTMSPWGTHTLIAGITGAGKSGWIWSMLYGLREAIACGLVEVHAIDPKGGREVGMGLQLFERFVYGRRWAADATKMLEGLGERMFDRNEGAVGQNRMHVPAPGEDALIIILFDELAAINHLDTKEKGPLTKALYPLMEQGRAAGFGVVAAVQDPRVETIPFRTLFSRFVGLRLPRSIIDPLFGEGAHARGMLCDQISPDEPGTAYAYSSDLVGVKVRSHWHDDAAVRRMAADYGRR